MKVAVFLGEVGEADVGGFTFQDEVLRTLVSEASSSAHDFIICGNAAPAVQERIRGAGLQFLQFSGLLPNRGRRFVAAAFEDLVMLARSAGLRSRFDRTLAAQDVEMVWFIAPFHEATDLPFIYTVWDLQHRVQPWFPEVSSGGRWLFRERSYRQMFQRAYAIIVPNAAGTAELQQYYSVARERILELPHPTPSFALMPDADEAVAPRICAEDYVFYPAQFVAHKNHVSALRGIKRLEELHGKRLAVVFVGPDGGNLAHVIAEARRLGIEHRVHLPGFVPREQLKQLYRNALALLYLSFFGPENLPPLEAFGLGCPVVAARVHGAAEQFGNAALLVDPVDYDEIANRLNEICTRPELRAELIALGQARARRWTTRDYVTNVIRSIDGFQRVRACWPGAIASGGRSAPRSTPT